MISDNLGTTIRKIDTVFAIGSVTITVFMMIEVGTRIVIGDSVGVGVGGDLIRTITLCN